MGEALEVVLADDHVLLLDALAGVLQDGGHRVLATGTSARTMAEQVRAFRPDVCITEARLGGGDCVEMFAGLMAESPGTKLVVLTADSSTDTMQRAVQSGAAAVIHKSRRLAVLLDVLRRVTEGEVVVQGPFTRPPVLRAASAHVRQLSAYLTSRELECLALLTEGMDTEAMSRHLGVSPTTVRSHIQAVLTKLGVHSRLEAASVAVRLGLGAPPRP